MAGGGIKPRGEEDATCCGYDIGSDLLTGLKE